MECPQVELQEYAPFDALLFQRRIPKTSSLDTRFFAHKSGADCRTSPESLEHLKAKFIIAQSARAAGWQVFTEESGLILMATPPQITLDHKPGDDLADE